MTQKTLETKSKEQSNALNAWHKAGYRGSIIAGTGFGKSRCGVLAIDHALKDGGRGLVLVPTNQLQDQFADEFRKWGKEHLLSRVEILCYQSAYKLRGEHYTIVVCDEIHLGLSPKYRRFFYTNTYDKLLCMTATIPEDVFYQGILKEMAPVVYTITLNECVKKGLVSPYEIELVPVELTDVESKASSAVKMARAKIRLIRQLLEMNMNVMVSDVDTVWLQVRFLSSRVREERASSPRANDMSNRH